MKTKTKATVKRTKTVKAAPAPHAAKTGATVAPSASMQARRAAAAAIPTADTIARCNALVDELMLILPSAADLVPKNKRRVIRMRKGGESIATHIAQVATQKGINLPNLSVESINIQSDALIALIQLSSNLRVAHTTLANYQFVLKSSIWGTATSLYSILKRLAQSDQHLEKMLAPATRFFAHRTPAVRANHPKTAKGKAALAARRAAGEG